MAAFVLQPHVAEFLDVVMHDGTLEFRLEELVVADGSPLAGVSLRDAHIRDHTGALILAMRSIDGTFTTNPHPKPCSAPVRSSSPSAPSPSSKPSPPSPNPGDR
jgi:Putative regulatory, ligand-binding protein related to C-terminal domains of K+ channels